MVFNDDISTSPPISPLSALKDEDSLFVLGEYINYI